MHPATVALLVVALVAIVIAVAVVGRSRSAARSPGGMQGAATREPSIYQQVRDQLRGSPDGLLDVGRIHTDDPVPEGPVRFAPGASDALFGPREGDADWKKVLDLIRVACRGKPLEWTAVEAVTAEARAASHVDQLIDRLQVSDLTPGVRELFWKAALESRRSETVKWGIAIGGMGLRPDQLEPLLVLAHHAEFTLYAAHVLMHEGAVEPRYRRKLVDLLPQARQWGVVRLIDYIVASEDLIADAGVQRDVVIHGMENIDGIPMEVAFTIAKSVDARSMMAASRHDERMRRAFFDLMDTLLTQPKPCGGLADLDGWEQLYDAWVEFLEQCDSDATLLGALRSLRLFLGNDALQWSRRQQERDRIERLWKARYSPEALRRGLEHGRDRRLSLQIIEEQQLRELLRDVRRVHAQRPDYDSISVLAKIGGEEDLEALRASIGSLVDSEARKLIPFSTENVFGPEHEHAMEYGQIVRAMARLATPDAVTTIKSALVDYDPHIRAAACDAVANLRDDLVDDEIQAAIRARAKDSPSWVAGSARAAAKAHDIQD